MKNMKKSAPLQLPIPSNIKATFSITSSKDRMPKEKVCFLLLVLRETQSFACFHHDAMTCTFRGLSTKANETFRDNNECSLDLTSCWHPKLSIPWSVIRLVVALWLRGRWRCTIYKHYIQFNTTMLRRKWYENDIIPVGMLYVDILKWWNVVVHKPFLLHLSLSQRANVNWIHGVNRYFANDKYRCLRSLSLCFQCGLQW